MKNKRLFYTRLLVLSSLSIFVLSCSKDDNPPSEPEEELSLQFNPSTDNIILRHEFRAAWLTTVGNYDWPVRGASAASQSAALVSIIEQLKTDSVVIDDKFAVVATLAANRPDLQLFWVNRAAEEPQEPVPATVIQIKSLQEVLEKLR